MNQPTQLTAGGLAGSTAIVTGASRGFGRAIATALSAAGADVGAVAIAAYAERQGLDVDAFIRSSGPALRADQVGRAVLEIAGASTGTPDAYFLTSDGLSSLSRSA